MSATRNPDVDTPSTAPVLTKEWVDGAGETVTREWPLGTLADIDAKYGVLKADAIAGLNNVASLSLKSALGRTSLVARYGREGSGSVAGDDIGEVEELYAIDVLKDICEAPYFAVDMGATGTSYPAKWVTAQAAATKGLPLTDDKVAAVRLAVELRLSEQGITDYAVLHPETFAGYGWVSWSTGMKELRWHMLRGETSFYETGFILRVSRYGVKTSMMQADFDDINAVTSLPVTLSASMDKLIKSLPTGEWLKKPAQAEHLGKGRWRVTQEWHWSNQWSIVYGGTWNGP